MFKTRAEKIQKARVKEKKIQERKWRKYVTSLQDEHRRNLSDLREDHKRDKIRLKEEHISERKDIIDEKNRQIKDSDKAWGLFKGKISKLDCLTEKIDCLIETESLLEVSRVQKIGEIRAEIGYLKDHIAKKDEKITRLSRS